MVHGKTRNHEDENEKKISQRRPNADKFPGPDDPIHKKLIRNDAINISLDNQPQNLQCHEMQNQSQKP